MNKTVLVLGSVLGLAIAAPLVTAQADGDKGNWRAYKSMAVTDATTLQECGECHIAYPARFLDARAWKTLMSDLPNHFGEDASLDEATTKHIEQYLVDNSSRRSKAGSIKISEQRWFVHEHQEEDEVSPAQFAKAKTWANCKACHKDADKGYFDDD